MSINKRISELSRKTKETDIFLSLNIDGSGISKINTGIGFFDHMLNSLATHWGIDLEVDVKGDLYVDCHHTIEDVGIVLGMVIKDALEQGNSINRFGECFMPMDEALGFCALDICGRPFIVFDCSFKNEKIGEMDTCMIEEFFRAVAYNSGITLHLKTMYGANDHHKCEALFKAFGHAMNKACKLRRDQNPLSTKGVL